MKEKFSIRKSLFANPLNMFKVVFKSNKVILGKSTKSIIQISEKNEITKMISPLSTK